MRSTKTGLLGNTLNVDDLQWVRFDASIGAGTDSFYEYLLKVGLYSLVFGIELTRGGVRCHAPLAQLSRAQSSNRRV